ncbi:hypothetical protein HID58_025712 [Brassica napus]|uniref:Protein kinase domain-containing protein n=1 Tax=Brassica napus TaxID=3708 RepID=A0ABQ8CMJ4_BRANA|nr:hypothetical protein HID58_025712 [Brassica napus]
MKTISVLAFFFFLLFLMAEAQRKNRTRCDTFSCGSLDFKFPFFRTDMESRCGLFKLNCSDHHFPEIQLEEKGLWYKVISVSQANTITITDPRLNQSLETGSCTDLSSFSIPDSPWLELTDLYKCNNSRKNGFTYANCQGGGSSLYYSKLEEHSGCSVIKSPESWVIPRNKNQSNLNATFSLHIDLPGSCHRCYRRGGECNMINDKFRCIGGTKRPNNHQGEKLKLGLGIGGSVILIIILAALFITIHRMYRRKTSPDLLSRNNSKSDVEFSNVFFKLPIFSYKELQEATDNFSKDRLLGDGGFGTVYYGKVRDGREVAVKRLYEHNYRRLEQFMNEIEILTRLHHKNLVSLYGCTSRRSRELLLVYEFVPNAINKIQNHATHELIDKSLGYGKNEGVCKMTTMVAELAFRCLQQDSTLRPRMEQVVQELKGIQKEDRKEETLTSYPSPPEWDEASLIKNMKFPRSPISVTDQWTSKSTTPNISAYDC